MTLGNSSLSVDFGDNCSSTAVLHAALASCTNSTEGNVSSATHNGGESIVGVSWDNYGVTCELHVELSHIYVTEENFNVSVTAVVARLDERTVAENWTVLRVRSPVENLSVLVDSVVAARQNVTVCASMSSVSHYVTYRWTVSRFDFMQAEMNSSELLSTSTDVPELVLVLNDVGDYLINVTVENEISKSTVDVIVTAVVPVSAVELLCDTSEYFLTNAIFVCTATVEKGTDVGFVWDFDDDLSVPVTTGNSSSTAAVTYPAVGEYNITVTAWNQLGARAAWKTVDIVENVFGLSALATEPVLVGQPVSVMACCMLGSNLTLVFDFGSGTRRLMLDLDSGTVTASHVYWMPGSYAVTVRAENNVSLAVTHVLVNVLQNVSDVDLTPVTSLVAGRHSVFMATFNGNYPCLSHFV